MSETTGQKHTDYPYKRYVENKSRMTPLSKLTYSFFECSIMLNIDSLTISFNGLVDLSVGVKIFLPLKFPPIILIYQ